MLDPSRLNDVDAFSPAVSRDGKWIAYSYRDNKATPTKGVAIMAFGGGLPTKRIDISTESLRWSPDSRSLLCQVRRWRLKHLEPADRERDTDADHPPQWRRVADFDLSRDGKRIVMERGRETSDVMLIRDLR